MVRWHHQLNDLQTALEQFSENVMGKGGGANTQRNNFVPEALLGK